VPVFAVSRGRLVSQLDLAAQRRVTVVVAPPGYGKTVLVSQWAAAHPRRRVRWLTIGPGRDGGRFARDLCDALGTSAPTSRNTPLAGLDGTDQAAGTAFLASLRADLETEPPTTVVLDDFHRLSNPGLLDELGVLIEHLPRWIHVVLVTQVDPPLHYHRLRLADELVEVRQDDLAFRWGEAAELLRRLVGHDLTTAQVDMLMARTEGWAVGLQLAAVSLRQRADPGSFVRTFAENDRHVADYLTEQVLHQQPEAIRQFLLSTSVLDRMSGPLCNAVTGGTGAHATLEELERRSLFITAVDARGEWFRYHQLFRALLRHHLRDEDPARERLLLRRAAAWHLARDDLDTGVDCLAEAGASEEILEAAFTHGGALVAQGRPATVARWIERVPPSLQHGHSRVMLLHAAASIMGGETRRAGEELDMIDGLDSASAADHVVADLLRARSALHDGAVAPAIVAADRVLSDVGTVDEAEVPSLLGLLGGRQDVAAAAWLTRGVALFLDGDVPAARGDLEAVLDGGHIAWQVRALASLALVDAWSGRLTSAGRFGARALKSARQLGLDQQPITADALLALATVARHREEFGDAARRLEQVAERVAPGRHPVLATLLATEQALLALGTGVPADGLAVLGRLRRAAPTSEPPAVTARRRAVEARLRIMIGDLDGAQLALDGAGHDSMDSVAGRMRLAVERGDLHTARRLVVRWPSKPEPRAHIERQLWLAILDHADGDQATACGRMAAVVAQTEPEWDLGLLRTAGHHVLGPARPLYRADPSPFLRAIVNPQGAAATRTPGPRRELVDPLTERESALLALLPTRLSNAEIASRLGVSVNTVKTHVKHVYRKLGVAGRSEAVAAAERMRLI
jgi:LuxR family maltose regulon positive regulatory protein